MLTVKGWSLLICIVVSTLMWIGIVFVVRGYVKQKPVEVKVSKAEIIDLDKWADAIHKAEGNDNYGIISIPCSDKECRRYCMNTIYNTLVKYRSTRCHKGEADLDCLARRYCPIGSNTDDGTCQYWKGNVKYFLQSG